MNECLEHLPEHGRTLLCRRYERGESAPVLGLAFNLSADAVRQMLVRLRADRKTLCGGQTRRGIRMNEPRYQELLGQVLDEEIGPRGLDELSEALRRDPQRLRDFQTHLVLWELFSQQRRPERNAEAFVSAWRTRLAAENDAADFLARTVDQLEPSVPESVIAGEPTAPHSAGEADESGGRWVWQMVELILAASKRRWAQGWPSRCAWS